MTRNKNWRYDKLYAYKRGRKPLRARVTLSSRNEWSGYLEWFPVPHARDAEPHRIAMTNRYASPYKAMEELDDQLKRFAKAASNLAGMTTVKK